MENILAAVFTLIPGLSRRDIENIYINHNGRIYQFKELCEIVERPAKRSGLVRSGDDPAVTLAIINRTMPRWLICRKVLPR